MKIKISYLWCIFLPLVIYTHLYKIMFFLFILMSIHEGMHLFCAFYFKYQIESVTIYPFGLHASILDFEYQNSFHEILIILSGLSVHVLAAFFIPFLNYSDVFSVSFIHYLYETNIALLFFNLLPLYPLDGGRILRNILEYFFPFKWAKGISLLLTLMILPICLYLFPFTLLQCIFFYIFFIIQISFSIVYFKYDVEAFYLYRYLHGSKGKMKIHHRKDLYKNKENYFLYKGYLLNEKEMLGRWI